MAWRVDGLARCQPLQGDLCWHSLLAWPKPRARGSQVLEHPDRLLHLLAARPAHLRLRPRGRPDLPLAAPPLRDPALGRPRGPAQRGTGACGRRLQLRSHHVGDACTKAAAQGAELRPGPRVRGLGRLDPGHEPAAGDPAGAAQAPQGVSQLLPDGSADEQGRAAAAAPHPQAGAPQGPEDAHGLPLLSPSGRLPRGSLQAWSASGPESEDVCTGGFERLGTSSWLLTSAGAGASLLLVACVLVGPLRCMSPPLIAGYIALGQCRV
mmetsp:Transcript_54009/g.167408  ORF Transcript_54009/g.167408 Transcript_54009/m.167408 type:complete len:266 (+) Transcript_54009:1569-2366(+)